MVRVRVAVGCGGCGMDGCAEGARSIIDRRQRPEAALYGTEPLCTQQVN